MKRVFAPGCALMIYKPQLAARMLSCLYREFGEIDQHLTCCRHEPELPTGTEIVNTCAGCDKRYRELYEGITTVSLWEVLAKSTTFPFPDYGGRKMAVLDACPTRDQDIIHVTIRALLRRMNVAVVEPAHTKTKSTCCGDSFYGTLPVKRVEKQMKRRASEMPADDVVTYCVSCSKSMYIGGRKPRYMVDLLLGEDTTPGTFEPDAWHAELDSFIAAH